MTARLVQVTNVSTSVTKEQLRALFTHLGRIEDIQLYPESETLVATVGAKTGYIRFDRSELAQAALNLTNTVFLDRPIICSLVKPSSSSSSSSHYTRIPDETVAIKLCPPMNPNVGLIAGGITWPHNVINRIVNVTSGQTVSSFIETVDPSLSERSLPAYPRLPGTMDQQKAEEIRRTVYVSNLDPRVSFAHLYELFNQVGEIRFIRLTNSLKDLQCENLGMSTLLIKQQEHVDFEADSIGAYIEFSEQPSVPKALCLNGLMFAQRHIQVNHATQSVTIPATTKQQISVDDLRKEISKLKRQSSSSSTAISSSSSSHRDRDKGRERDREHRDRDRRDHHRHESHSGKHRSDTSSRSVKLEKKADSSVNSSPGQSDEEDEEPMEAAAAAAVMANAADSAESSGMASPPPRKQRRSRSESKSKHESASKSKKRSSRSPRERHHRSKEREKQREKERERDKVKSSTSSSSSHHRSSTSVSTKSADASKSSHRSSTNGTSSSKRSQSSRKRSTSRSGKASKRSKSPKEDKHRSKDSKKSSHSSKRRSKSKEKSSSSRNHHSSSSHHKHSKSESKKSSRESRDKKPSRHSSGAMDPPAANSIKPRDYDEEEREATMEVNDVEVAVKAEFDVYGPNPVGADRNGSNVDENMNEEHETSSDNSSSSESSDQEEEEAAPAGLSESSSGAETPLKSRGVLKDCGNEEAKRASSKSNGHGKS